MSEFFSVKLGKDTCARFGFDGTGCDKPFVQDIDETGIFGYSLKKMAPRAKLREEARLQFRGDLIERPAAELDT